MKRQFLSDREHAEHLRGHYGQSQYLEVAPSHGGGTPVPVMTDCGRVFVNVSDVGIERLIDSENPALFKVLRELRDSALKQEYQVLLAKEQQERVGHNRARMHKAPKFDWGVVYVLKAAGHRQYKIGKTRQYAQRMSAFGIQLPFAVSPVHTIETDDITWLERLLHKRFKGKRMRGEWFRLEAADLAWLRGFRAIHHYEHPEDDTSGAGRGR